MFMEVKMSEYNVIEKIKFAKVKLLMEHNFLGALLLQFPIMETKRKNLKTCATDNVNIYYSKEFIEKCTKEEVVGLIAHELMHIFFKHFVRFDLKSMKYAFVANMAMDYAINSIIVNDLKLQIPEGGLYDNRWLGHNAEKILTELMNEKDIQDQMSMMDKMIKDGDAMEEVMNKIGNQLANNSHKISQELTEKLGKSKQQKKKMADEINDKIQTAWARTNENERGLISGSLKREIDDIEKLKKGFINWKKFIQQRIMEMGRTQHDSRKFNKKMIGQDWYLTGMSGSKAIIGMALDTSGSISEKEILTFLGEIKNLVSRFPNIEIIMYGCDSKIHGKADIKGKRQFKMKYLKDLLNGGGGTSHFPIFEDIEKSKLRMKLLFCFTDGFSDINHIPEHHRKLVNRTYWVLPKSSEEVTLDWGQKIIIAEEKEY